jgi:predicted kinase/transcriptional regulator with XRE-family HTH domain
MLTNRELVGDVGKDRSGWCPERLREAREAHGLTLEAAGEQLRDTARRAGLTAPAANFQTLWQHEQGEVYPGPHYRRAYCLLYQAGEPDLGFRKPLPGEEGRRQLSEFRGQLDTVRAQAVARALKQLLPRSADERPADDLRQRILDAWQQRHTDGEPGKPSLVLVGGFAGSGKSEFARFISQLTGWPLLDKDPITRPLVERLLVELDCDPNDRQSETYRTQVRPLEYQCLMDSILVNVECGISTVATAPFISEMTDPVWMRRLANRCAAYQVEVIPVWLACDQDSMREYIAFRSAARDAWKLSNWAQYLDGLDLDLRPSVPHLVVDNRYGSAIAIADQARFALGAVRT